MGRVRGAVRRGVAPRDARRSPVRASPVGALSAWGRLLRVVRALPGADCCTSRRQVAATTGRAVLPPAAAVVGGAAENPSAEPVLTFRALPGSRVRDRWTVGGSASVPTEDVAAGGVTGARPPGRLGPVFRMRTGAGGVAGEAALPGAGVSASTARCTGEGWPGSGAERTGIEGGALGAGGGVAAPAGALRGAGVPEGPGCVRRRSPRSGASRWTRAVGGSEVRGVPIPPRVRGPPDASAGGVDPGAPGRGAGRDAPGDGCAGPVAGAFRTGAGAGVGT